MELKRKAEYIVYEVESQNTLQEFYMMLKSELSDIYRDEFKLELLNLVSSGLKAEVDDHLSDGSCKRKYPNGGCPTELRYDDAFRYVEQEYDKIVEDINIYGKLNRFNADVFGDQFSSNEKNYISESLDRLMNGQVMLVEGQLELSEQLKNGIDELKELLFVLNKKNWKEVFAGQLISAVIGLGINTENLQSLIDSAEKSIGVS